MRAVFSLFILRHPRDHPRDFKSTSILKKGNLVRSTTAITPLKKCSFEEISSTKIVFPTWPSFGKVVNSPR